MEWLVGRGLKESQGFLENVDLLVLMERLVSQDSKGYKAFRAQ